MFILVVQFHNQKFGGNIAEEKKPTGETQTANNCLGGLKPLLLIALLISFSFLLGHLKRRCSLIAACLNF